MIPVNMTVVHDPIAGTFGDCFRCCIASILELPAREVPHFCDKDSTNWYNDLLLYLAPLGLTYIDFLVNPAKPWSFDGQRIYHVMSGMSPNFPDLRHSVVALNGEIVHDPAPSKAGLRGPFDQPQFDDVGMYHYGLIILTGTWGK